ncbi:MAG TPA: circadian clock protein KaiC [Thermoanaerobaculia bacterium]
MSEGGGTPELRQLAKSPTGIEGFDSLSYGGLPTGRTTLVAGSSGSGKTVFAAQFLASGIRDHGESGVFVTFEESPADIRANMAAFGWDIAAWERDGRWAFVDASPDPEVEVLESGEYDLGGLLARIGGAVRKVGAARLAIDSLGAIFSQFQDAAIVRKELFRMAHTARALGVTAVMTAERTEEYGPIARHGVEEFLSDNVVVLRNVLEDEQRRRTVEILKFRGTDHQKGEYPFAIVSDQGIAVITLTGIELGQGSTAVRVSSGNDELDAMCGGGFFRDSVVLVSGATGTGKTLSVTHFLDGGVEAGDRCLLLGYEESREQLFRNASGWGCDFAAMEASGKLRVHCEYPEMRGLEDHLLRIKRLIEELRPQRVAVDSLSALERMGTPKAFRQFVIGLTSFIKDESITGLITNTTPTLVGGTSVTEAHISSLTDSIVLLRYVEILGEMRRGVMVLKMRGSPHDKEIRELTIDGTGMHIGQAFRTVSGILSGHPMQSRAEMDRLEGLFPEE